MRCLSVSIALALLVAPSLLRAEQAPIRDFVGRWQGSEISKPADDVASNDIRIVVRPRDQGFELAWTDLNTDDRNARPDRTIEARFVPTARPGVFEFAPKPGSFLDRMFASPSTGNPLNGETLLWARVQANTLAVYSLSIDSDGRFDLDHYLWTATEDGLTLRYSRRNQDLDDEVTVEGLLTSIGDGSSIGD